MNTSFFCSHGGAVLGADGPTAVFLAGEIGFSWNWINFFGLITVILLLVPNLIYVWKRKGTKNLCENRIMNFLEQAGRYGSMVFMVVCLKKGGYGFSSVGALLCYLSGNGILLSAYWIAWGIYFWKTGPGVRSKVWSSRKNGPTAVFIAGKTNVKGIIRTKMALAVIPSILFLLDGITLWNIPLLICGVLFAVSHLYVTWGNCKNSTYKGVSE